MEHQTVRQKKIDPAYRPIARDKNKAKIQCSEARRVMSSEGVAHPKHE